MNIDYSRIPDHMKKAIRQYIELGRPPGDFLRGVIQNKLAQACMYADPTNRDALRDWIIFFSNEVPPECWGSKEAYKAWVAEGGIQGPLEKEKETEATTNE